MLTVSTMCVFMIGKVKIRVAHAEIKAAGGNTPVPVPGQAVKPLIGRGMAGSADTAGRRRI